MSVKITRFGRFKVGSLVCAFHGGPTGTIREITVEKIIGAFTGLEFYSPRIMVEWFNFPGETFELTSSDLYLSE